MTLRRCPHCQSPQRGNWCGVCHRVIRPGKEARDWTHYLNANVGRRCNCAVCARIRQHTEGEYPR